MNSPKHAVEEMIGAKNGTHTSTSQTSATSCFTSKSILCNSNSNGNLKNGVHSNGDRDRSGVIEGKKRKRQTSETRGLNVLKGVSVCLTGLSAHRKTELHRLVVFLGGRCVLCLEV